MRDNVIEREVLSRGGKAIRCQEFLDGKVGKLNDLRPVDIDDGDETGACSEYSFFCVAQPPSWIKPRNSSGIKPNRQDLRQLLNTKRSSRHDQALKEPVRRLSSRFVDPTEYLFVRFIERLRQVIQST